MKSLIYFAAVAAALNFGSYAMAQDAPKADNTAVNNGDSDKNAVTADKQGSDKDQVTVLAAIRKSIMADNRLSVDAKNAKVLYFKGVVTLKGPVETEEEKARLADLAKANSCVSSVNNQLTVLSK